MDSKMGEGGQNGQITVFLSLRITFVLTYIGSVGMRKHYASNGKYGMGRCEIVFSSTDEKCIGSVWVFLWIPDYLDRNQVNSYPFWLGNLEKKHGEIS